MQNPSSLDRIVTYFHALARERFSFRGEEYKPYSVLHLSDKVFRSYTCPEMCGACCMRCSLVWDHPSELARTRVDFIINGVTQSFYTDDQIDSSDRYCRHLQKPEGRCGIYLDRPLPCRFELFKFIHVTSRNVVRAMVKLPGRNWTLMKTDGNRGALCKIIPYDKELTATHIRDLRIIKGWMDGFQIANDCDAVIKFLESGPHEQALKIQRSTRRTLL